MPAIARQGIYAHSLSPPSRALQKQKSLEMGCYLFLHPWVLPKTSTV
jgi:hypothetical protein